MSAFDPALFKPEALTVAAIRERGEPKLFEEDSAVWKARLKAWFEAETGRTLYPDQTEMFLVEMAAYAFAIKGSEAQRAILQNTIVWADGLALDAAVADNGITRLTARAAHVAVTATLQKSLAASLIIPAGTPLTSGAAIFRTDRDILLPAGALQASGTATAAAFGTASNGFQPGDLTGSFQGAALQNTSVSAGGADEEADDTLRQVGVDGPERYDRRGGWGGYGVEVRRVSALIDDVAIDRPEPGHIHVVPTILGDEPPGETLLQEIAAALPAGTVRPDGDTLTVRAPVPHDVHILWTARVDPLASEDEIEAGLTAATRAAFAKMRRPSLSGSDRTQFAVPAGRLGAQLSPARLISAGMTVPGIIDLDLSGLAFLDLPFDRYPRLASIAVDFVSGADV